MTGRYFFKLMQRFFSSDKLKTNAIRILESSNIKYSTVSYDVNENDLSGETVAKKINALPETVFKTLVTLGDKTGVTIFCIPIISELNLKRSAILSENKYIEMVKVKDIFNLTGYIRGGCSPIGMKKKYPTFIEETALIFDRIYVSAGIRGMQIYLSPLDLQKMTSAEFVNLI